MIRRCIACKTDKPYEDFGRGFNGTLRKKCLACESKPFKSSKRSLEQKREWRKTPRGRFYRTKERAKARGYVFSLSLEEYLAFVNEPCHYCGQQSSGVDRVDNTIGYEPHNCVSCCRMCNVMKNKFEVQEFLDHAQAIAAYQNEQKSPA